jgi:deoxyribonuclease-2
MGNCITCNKSSSSIVEIILTPKNTNKVYVALKFPHGQAGIEYSEKEKQFIPCLDINCWLNNIYSKSRWTSWQVYNDDTSHIGLNTHKKGHCKGIVAWNSTSISWLCHSVPNFPRTFTGNSLSEIEHGELIYGQSFQYIEIAYNETLLYLILHQLQIMESNIYIEKLDDKYNNTIIIPKTHALSEIKLTDTISHFAKSPHYHVDMYSDILAVQYPVEWYVETWIRGHHIEQKRLYPIFEIKSITFKDTTYTESQDHSKWAVSKDCAYYSIGDLNRMTSQYVRGGGSFMCKDENIAKAFYNLISNINK